MKKMYFHTVLLGVSHPATAGTAVSHARAGQPLLENSSLELVATYVVYTPGLIPLSTTYASGLRLECMTTVLLGASVRPGKGVKGRAKRSPGPRRDARSGAVAGRAPSLIVMEELFDANFMLQPDRFAQLYSVPRCVLFRLFQTKMLSLS